MCVYPGSGVWSVDVTRRRPLFHNTEILAFSFGVRAESVCEMNYSKRGSPMLDAERIFRDCHTILKITQKFNRFAGNNQIIADLQV